MAKEHIITVDFGGTKMLAAALNSKGEITARNKRPTTVSKSTNYAKEMAELVKELIEDEKIPSDDVKAVCVGVPGTVNMTTGVVGHAPNLGLVDYPMLAELKKHMPYPVFLENDVNLAALGIKQAGAAKDKKNVLVVFVGTGIGGGIILDGQLYRGSDFVAGEIGHVPAVVDGPVCGCGNKGCFEAVASRTAMVRDIEELVKDGKKSELEKHIKKGKRIKSKALLSALENDDKIVTKVISNACMHIGRTLAGINNLLNLDMIVLGGGVIEANDDYMMPLIQKSFKEYLMGPAFEKVELIATDLGDDAALYGGIPLAKEYLGA